MNNIEGINNFLDDKENNHLLINQVSEEIGIFYLYVIQHFSNSLGINSRFKWRFAPLSDLYLVYTDNSYFTDYRYSPKFKTINLKITYWLNI